MKLDDIKSPLPARVPLGNENSKAEEREADNPVLSQKKENEEGKKPRWIGVAVAGVVIIVLGMVGIKLLGKKEGGGGKEVVVNYWGLWEEESVLAGAVADFEAKNPGIKIRYTKGFYDNYRTRLAGRLQKDADQTEVPDIFRIHSSWIPMFVDSLAPVPNDTAKNIGLEDDFFEVYKRDLKRDGSYRAIPLMYDGLSLFYNKKLVEAAKVELPTTWWALERAAQKLTVKDENGRIKTAGVAMGAVENVDHWSDIVGLMMKQNGVDLKKDDIENNKKLENVLTFYTYFANKTGVWSESLPTATEFFASGNLAFYFAPSWRVFNLEEMNPNLEYGIMTVPQLPTLEGVNPDQMSDLAADNLTNIHWASYWVEGVNAKSKNKTAAFKFLEYLTSREGLERMYEAASQIRALGEIPPRVSMAAAVSENKKVKAFVDAAEYSSSGWTNARTFDDGLNDEMNKYFKDAINAIVRENASVESVIPTLRSGINQLVNKYQLNY